MAGIPTSAANPALLEAVLRRDRLIVAGGLALVALLAWAWTLTGAGTGMSMTAMTERSGMPGAMGMGMAMPVAWTPAYAVLMVFMWWIMMIAMMVPAASPMILLFATFNRKQRELGNPHVATGVFVAGYLLVWAVFSLVATGVQWGLEQTGILTPMMAVGSTYLAASVLIVAGLYQLTPLKQACLRHCRSPLDFISRHWRPGPIGALRMGIDHGAWCLGCCWFLMALLFVGGIMNIYWITGLALYVLIEKAVPYGHAISRMVGVALAAWGVALIAGLA